MKNALTLSAAVLLSLGVQAAPGLAAPTVYFERDDNSGFMTSFPNSQGAFNRFTGSLASFGVATIDAAAGVNPTLAFDGGVSAATQGVVAQAAPGFSIGSQALLELDAAGAPQGNTIFTFNEYVTAFGAFVIQGGDGASANPTTFRLRDTATSLFVDVPVQIGPGWGVSNVFFVGLTDTTAFNEVEIIEAIDADDGMLYDNIVAGSIVPEPGSLGLLALGAAGACALAGRSRRR